MTFLISFVAANTIESSTMVFEGALTCVDEVCTGTVAMIDENAEGLGDNIAGFDVFARNTALAMYDELSTGSNYLYGIISNHDAYLTGGGWGSGYDPDCGDWYNYQLRLDSGNWFLEYNGNVGNDGILTGASAPSMSGSVNWTTMYASETGVGAYYSGMGTPESNGYALDNEYTGVNTGESSWDMDWSWGSEYIPLEFAGFSVNITDIGSGNYTVILTPASANQVVEGTLEDYFWSISVNPATLQFGTIPRGSNIVDNADNGPIAISTEDSATADGNVYVAVDVIGEDASFYDALLELVVDSSWTDITAITTLIIPQESSRNYDARLHGDTSSIEPGPKSATIVYTAYGESLG